MKKKIFALAAFAALALLLVMVFAPLASANMVTKIMYAQEGVEYFKYTPAVSEDLYITCSWLDHNGNATSFPTSEVDAGITGGGTVIYADNDVADLYSGVNPASTTFAVTGGKDYWIAIYPYVDDCTATLTVQQTNAAGAHKTMTRLSTGLSVTSPVTGIQAYASDGEAYVPANAGTTDWYSCLQYWPGTLSPKAYWACWNDYAYSRVPGTVYDTFSEAYLNNFTSNPGQGPQRTSVTPAMSGQWVSITPEIWPAGNGGSVVDSKDNPIPGYLAPATAPAWYTYAYEDAGVTTTKPGYFWGNTTSASASKRNYSTSTSLSGKMDVAFAGNSITWNYTKGKGYGRAHVVIDSTDKGNVSQYNNGFLYKQTSTFSGLGAGNHVIHITNLGKDTLSTNSTISSDRFDAQGVSELPVGSDPTPYMENNYDGSTTFKWGTSANVAASGGSYSTETSLSAATAFVFKGTAVTWKFTGGKGYGVAHVFIDNVDKGLVSQYRSGFSYQQTATFTGLTDTTHSILILNIGKDTLSTNSTISSDAFVVTGSGAGTYEDN